MTNESIVHVIDDYAAARDSLGFLLDCAGLPVRTYPSAADFLTVASNARQGCIVTDVRMPDMNGLEMVARLRALGVLLPVIIITGHADVPLAIQAMKAGVADFVEKPFGDDAILKAIRSALASHVERGQRERNRDDIVTRLATLSTREKQVLEGLIEGQANKVIAYDLSISARTVEVYRANVMTKMGAASLSELIQLVMTARLS